MKEDTRVIILSIIGAVLFFTFLIFMIYFGNQTYNKECLESFAKEYCIKNNMSLDYGYYRYSFYCEDIVSERFGYEDREEFYFLSSEREACLTKNKWSLKRIK